MRTVDWSASPFGDPFGWPAALQAACRICLTSRFPMIIWWGPELRFFYNDACVPLLGDKHPGLGKRGSDVWPEIWHIVGPMLAGVLASGTATWSEDLLLPMDRHGYLEETYWTYSFSPLYDAADEVAGVFTAVSDTTERVVGERRLGVLRDLAARGGGGESVPEACRLVTDCLRDCGSDVPLAAVYLPDEAGGFRLVASTAAGPDLLPQPDGPGGWPLVDAARSGQPVVVRDVVARFGALPAGGWHVPPREAVVLPVSDSLGAVLVLAANASRALDDAYLNFLELVARQTEAFLDRAVAYHVQQRRAEELTELDRAKTTFFSNISHEFRTPLTLIMGPVKELLSAPSVDSGRLHAELEIVHRNALRLGKLVNTLLDFSRIEAGRMQASYAEVDLAALTTELAGVFRGAMELAGIDFQVDCPPLPGRTCVDRSMWEKIVLNLLSNALKFTFDGTVRVSLTDEAGHAVLRVADTGVGIPAAEMPRLFERFHRIPTTQARSDEGSGIGLAMVRELVLLHGGTITADSEQGFGTTFTVRIPYGCGHVRGNPGPGEAQHGVADGVEPYLAEATRWLPDTAAGDQRSDPASDARVLVADDNADMRDYLTRLLAPSYRLEIVADGAAALRSALREPPDLVISDVMMPGLDGLGLVSALRADPRTERVPVLLLSARAGSEASIDGLAVGADDYVVKPFEGDELQARVRARLELSRLRNHYADWRAAMVNSLQEGFFVADDQGTVEEVNDAFGQVLGYGADGVPYPLPQPWWPDPVTDPENHRKVATVVAGMLREGSGAVTVPLRHRDGHRIWAAVTCNEVREPGDGRLMYVGTVRDVTAERTAVQREAAQASLSTRLSEAGSVAEVVTAGLAELAELWQARRGIAVLPMPGGGSALFSTVPDTRWDDLGADLRARLRGHADEPPLHITTEPHPDRPGWVTGAGTRVANPDGALTVWLEWDPAVRFDAGDRSLLALLCACVGQALHRAHESDEQRAIALALQRSILGPSDLPAGFAVRYEPASEPLEVGGDWYDVVTLADGRIGLVVGDCVGSGLGAAVVMGQLRSACRALLLEMGGPARVLTALDDFAGKVPDAMCTTVFCGVLDPATGVLRYTSAGHPPALLVHDDGTTTSLDGGHSLPLSIAAGLARPEGEITVPLGSTLLLYTDGLVERRGSVIDDGIEQVADVLRHSTNLEVEPLIRHVMTGLRPSTGFDDDVAVLAYRRPDPFDLRFPADPARLRPVRQALGEWLTRLSLDPTLVDDILIAVGEACANAIEHGSALDPGKEVRLTGSVVDGDVKLSIVDKGRWREPDPNGSEERGRGLPLMTGLMRDVVVDRGPDGTAVHLAVPCRRFRLVIAG